MSCDNCSQSSYSTNITSCSTSDTDASKIKYTGPLLSCTDVSSGTTLDTILQTFDAAICENSGVDWSAFDYNCLTTLCDCSITSAEQFVDAMTSAFCTLNTDYNTFVNTTYPDDMTNITDIINSIINPELTLNCISVNNEDNLSGILSKINTAVCNINGVIYEPEFSFSCANVSTSDDLLTVIYKLGTKLCSIDTTVTTIENTLLPTFNNSASCLSTTGTSDTLYDTVVAIRDLLCTKVDFDPSGISWGCLSSETTLTNTIQTMINSISALNQVKIVTVNGIEGSSTRVTAVLTPIDIENECAGYDLSIIDLDDTFDIKVKTNSSDSTSGYLVDKIVEGNGIDISVVDVAGVKHLKVDALNEDTYQVKVKSDGSDTEGFLIDKLDVASTLDNALVLTKAYSSTLDSLVITPALNYETLASQILYSIVNNTTLNNIFCNMLACKCDCSNPENSNRFVAYYVESVAASTDFNLDLNFAQIPAPSNFYQGSVVVNHTTSFSTGYYTITDNQNTVNTTLSITNNNVGDTLYYNIFVEFSTGGTPTGSSYASGSISPLGTLDFNPFTSTPFILGDPLGSNSYVRVTIQINDTEFT